MTESITCPRCGRTSHNPNDVREGFCGHCHDWTRDAVEDEHSLDGLTDGQLADEMATWEY